MCRAERGGGAGRGWRQWAVAAPFPCSPHPITRLPLPFGLAHCALLQVLVVANPANTNSLILKEHAPSIPTGELHYRVELWWGWVRGGWAGERQPCSLRPPSPPVSCAVGYSCTVEQMDVPPVGSRQSFLPLTPRPLPCPVPAPAENITCMTRLDHNRALGQVSEWVGGSVGDQLASRAASQEQQARRPCSRLRMLQPPCGCLCFLTACPVQKPSPGALALSSSPSGVFDSCCTPCRSSRLPAAERAQRRPREQGEERRHLGQPLLHPGWLGAAQQEQQQQQCLFSVQHPAQHCRPQPPRLPVCVLWPRGAPHEPE